MTDDQRNLSALTFDALRGKFIADAHLGNGTGCRCCDLVDEGTLAALIDAAEALEALLSLDKGCTFVRRGEKHDEVEMRVKVSAHTAGMDALERFWS